MTTLELFPELDLPPMESSAMVWPTPSATTGLSGGSGAPWKVKGQTFDEWMSSAAASHVKTSARPAKARASTAPAADYGASTPELLAKFDRDTSSWRTSQLCLDGDYQEYSETWPRSGLMRNGIAYRLPPLVRLTGAIEFGSSPIPTPTAGDAKSAGTRNTSASQAHPGISLTDYVRGDGGTGRQMFPTPTGQDAENNGNRSQFERNSIPLNAVIGGSLNPTWVEWLMGFPLEWTALERSAMPSCRKSSK